MSPATDPGRAAEEMQEVRYLRAVIDTLRQELVTERKLVKGFEADLIAARKERDEALKLRKEDRAWYEMTVSVVEEQRENYRAEAAQLRARLHEAEKGAGAMRDALDQAEACMSIVAPRSDKAEYLRTLGVVRAALAAKSAPPLNRSETDGGRHGPEA